MAQRLPDPRLPQVRGLAISATAHGLGIAIALAASGLWPTPHASWGASEPVSIRLPIRPAPLAEIQPVEPAEPAPELAVAGEPSSPAFDLEPVDIAELLPDTGEAPGELPIVRTPPPSARPRPSQWLAVVRPKPPAQQPANAAASQPPAAAPTPAFVQPSPLTSRNEPPRYPFVAWRHGIEGTVVVILEIAADGSVHAAHVESSSGSSQLDDAALEALSAWRFEPARDGSRAAVGTWRQVVVFRLAAKAVELGSPAN